MASVVVLLAKFRQANAHIFGKNAEKEVVYKGYCEEKADNNQKI
jgi:hypothetical protein